MKVFLECLPCALRQVLEASKMATDDPAEQSAIMRDAIELLRRYDSFPNSPAIAREIHRIVKARTGCADPYAAVKQRDLDTALRLLPMLKQRAAGREDPLYWGLKAAATGNVLDSAITANYNHHRFDEEFDRPFALCDLPALRERLQTAKSLMIIGDNTGETVFDCLLLRQFPHLRLTYAVRSAPAINDATEAEARASGIEAYAEILSTGCDVPGVLLDECSDAFLERFYGADIVISKGQGNLETLSDAPRDLFFLLKAKCPVIAGLLGVELNDYVFRYQPGP